MANLSSSVKLGTGSVSSLIKSANTLQTEEANLQDSIMRDQFNNSLRTSSDLTTYANYLKGRIKILQDSGTITNASKALSLNQEIITATHASASADIQRATINVLDGQGTDNQKLDAIGRAFQRLYAIGDLSAAQAYEQQYYSLSQSIQLKQAQAAAAIGSGSGGGGRGGSSGLSSSITEAIDQAKNQIQNAAAAWEAQGPKFLDKVSSQALKDAGAKTSGVATIFSALAGRVGMVNKGVQLNNTTKYEQGTYTPGSVLDIYTQAIQLNPSSAQTYKDYIDNYLNGSTSIDLPGGGGSITYNALMNTVYAGNSGTSPYGIDRTVGPDGHPQWQIKRLNVNGYVYGKDLNGHTVLMPSYSFYSRPIPTGTMNALKASGMNVKSDSNGDYWFQTTSQSSGMSRVLGNYPTLGVLQKDGSIQFMGNDGKLYQMVEGKKQGTYGLQQVDAFGQIVNANAGGNYGFVPKKQAIGNEDFLHRTLGTSANPVGKVNGNDIYVKGDKTYQLVNVNGLYGLQQIDKNGNVVNANVAGQYGFNPDKNAKLSPAAKQIMKSPSFGWGNAMHNIETLFGLFGNHAKAATSDFQTVFHHEGIDINTLMSNAEVIQTANLAHHQYMLAMAPPPVLPKIHIAPFRPAAQPRISVPSYTPRINIMPSYQTAPKAPAPQNPNYGVGQQSSPQIQGGSFNLQGAGPGSISL